MTTIYLVVHSDKHVDDTITPCASRGTALTLAKASVRLAMEHYHVQPREVVMGLTDSMLKAGWLYFAQLEDAFSVHVEPQELRP